MINGAVVLLSIIIVTGIFSVFALLLSLVSISMIVGFKNSTHTIEWKPLEKHEAKLDDDFGDNEEWLENPNKVVRKPKIDNPFPPEEPQDEDPFFDEDDPNNTSSNLI